MPSSEEVNTCWIHFVFDGDILTRTVKVLYVGGHHFTSESFLNEGQSKLDLLQN